MKKLLMAFGVLAFPGVTAVGSLAYAPAADAQGSRVSCTYTYFHDEALTEYFTTVRCSCAEPDCYNSVEVTPFYTVECIDAC